MSPSNSDIRKAKIRRVIISSELPGHVSLMAVLDN